MIVLDPQLLDRLRRRRGRRLRPRGPGRGPGRGDRAGRRDGWRFPPRVPSPSWPPGWPPWAAPSRASRRRGSRRRCAPTNARARLAGRMCDSGLGGCLADDMGLGKTIQLIALHLRRQDARRPAPTLVVCPASLARQLGARDPALRPGRPGPPLPRRRRATWRDLGPTRSCSTTYGVVPSRPRAAGRGRLGPASSPTRRSTSRTRCPARRARCGRCRRPAVSR